MLSVGHSSSSSFYYPLTPNYPGIDLNLGCPQRVAHSGHFGSYLLGQEDRDLVVQLVRTVSAGISIPLFVKIRLLDTVPDTLRLCVELIEAGAALIAIHARYILSMSSRI
jgi:tRNA-dihydrouridine synthase 1